ncbi:2OG-Fe(II) oxygenase [Streptomyces sp. AV19]|uniref:2OG-Fe(II) oxygenase n=1 Tax=Streptomyces sp. AV19 TaxID=2793068 RepID=UPI0018FE719F|nr:2OG-Fe(II) oxygenase [Streptomyces sp. AV19]MBH1938260.1 2OG-Fe(II) oxygenase [Streptomyces sp. AV19]MDG4534890.1 2OG-Fe(II) oxygenase [Streptomyces sp. AV19]
MTENVGVAEAPPPGDAAPRATATTAVVLATQMCRFDDVLGAAAADRLLEEGCHALMAEVRDRGAEAESVVPPSWRCADQTARFPALVAVVTRLAPMVMTLLGVPVTDARVSFGLTMHNELPGGEGAQPAPVRDSAGAGRITFLYHLHRRPRGFTGGQTRVFDSTVREGRPGVAESFRDVRPDHDSLLFFPADAWYQVRPVTSPSAKLLDSRFAFHGWLGAADR